MATRMAQSVLIRPVPEFNANVEVGASLALRWKDWLTDFKMFITASGITDHKRQRALLLYQAGPRVRVIFKQLADTGGDGDYKLCKQKLLEYFEPQRNRCYDFSGTKLGKEAEFLA